MRDDDVVVETAVIPVSLGMADLSGSVVAGRYRLTSALGQGAMANVYRATDGRLDRQVAVKLFHPGQDSVVRSRFGAEAQALARLSHPGLVSIFDAGVECDRPYLVMQLVDGESLRDRLLNGALPTDDIVLLGAKLATALAHVHRNGIVHRDIKPSNIVLDANGSPHLADFGIALLLDAARVTGSGEIMGTAAYLAPEQILGIEVGSAADVYALGLVLLECVTGELEYPGASKVESALARLHRQPRIPDDVPGVLAELLTAMTARHAGDRPAAGECAAWFWAVREHGAISRRTARLAAAKWLARKGNQLSGAHAPVLPGWRRYALAGSGLAMAVLASTWLFTSLLPNVMPPAPVEGAVTGSPSTVGESRPGPRPDIVPPNMHMAAALTTTGNSGADSDAAPGTRAGPNLADSTNRLSITSTSLFGVTTTMTTVPTATTDPDQLQTETTDSPPIDMGPNSPGPMMSTTTQPPSGTDTTPPTTTDTTPPTDTTTADTTPPTSSSPVMIVARPNNQTQGQRTGSISPE